MVGFLSCRERCNGSCEVTQCARRPSPLDQVGVALKEGRQEGAAPRLALHAPSSVPAHVTQQHCCLDYREPKIFTPVQFGSAEAAPLQAMPRPRWQP